ncbi:MAG: MOSC N-terminal beta barrel domain-containing protein [gamma proteobacterium symbiont of Bathyaustriella thionipta]|nr:MOSC N-terminal beta barrel domain-containing protein [gamma proteobacterium symbiont of Bathyaustriella thionipta]MCU7951580.1 MOSC N-terminal beta barrel domain-containing protein [gamma proteobacterium symbiont of Bathyaustriella thionipta]MCU7958169.1 MOSC N-terminal beta barrel domain-containing protein [gamma proteobacterium symbiont of Bathyaustriella thionipta]MCU7967630.1 MOSC N-terminal beta barrel domain-containing protein [gamma proteobacterium symbiont of Bathyaustriella thionipt
MPDVVVSQLWIYPIKSLSGISLDSVLLEKRGFQYDRRWMLVDKENRFITQRQYPEMTLIEPELSDFGLAIRAPDMPVLIIPYPDPQIELYDEVEVTCWDDQITAHHINTAIDNWFSEFLDVDCQLVYMPDNSMRAVDPEYSLNDDIASFSDGFPNLIISEASLDDLNSRVDSGLTMSRFRPNIVISGCEPYAEDSLGHFKIEQIEFYAVKPCSRCVITTINPISGEKESREPLNTLAQFRKKNNKVFFGQNLLHKLSYINDNHLHVGDKLTVIKPSEPLEFDQQA